MDVALQLYSIKEDVAADFDGALAMTSRAGYSGVEFAGYQGLALDRLRGLLDKHHLKAVGSHVGLERMRDAFDEECAYAAALGYRLIICPWSPCRTREECVETARFLEGCAREARKAGLVVGYHNHAQEFARFDGRFAMDILLENMPSVRYEPDVYWIAWAGVDPVAYLETLKKTGRVCAVHAKDIARGGKDNVYVGEGCIDFASLAAMYAPQTYPYVVEQETFSSDHFDGISRSCAGLMRAVCA